MSYASELGRVTGGLTKQAGVAAILAKVLRRAVQSGGRFMHRTRKGWIKDLPTGPIGKRPFQPRVMWPHNIKAQDQWAVRTGLHTPRAVAWRPPPVTEAIFPGGRAPGLLGK